MKRFVKIMSAVLIVLFCLSSVSALAEFCVTTTARINLRTAPGIGFASLGLIDRGVTLSVAETGKDAGGVIWYRVTSGGKTGWICSTYAKESAAPAARTVSMKGNANVRAGAGLGYVSLGVIEKGATAAYLNSAAVDERGVVWYRINYGGLIGWVSAKYAVLN